MLSELLAYLAVKPHILSFVYLVTLDNSVVQKKEDFCMPEVCPSGNFISLEKLLEGRLRDISILNSSVTEIDRRDLTK